MTLTVEVRRGRLVESRHQVHAVVVDAEGATVASWGEPDRLTHPRSCVKAIQALPLVESGAAEAAGCSQIELALACASHNGEAAHVDAVDAWLARIGRSHEDLACGVQAGRGTTASANNCSGKHAGFLTLAHHLGVDPAGYTDPDHPVQRLVTAALADVFQTDLDPADAGVDGCGIPAHAMPLRALAGTAIRMAAPPAWWPAERRAAADRLIGAMVAEPWYVAGTDRLSTDLMRAAEGEIVVKAGAEGVQWAALPRLGLGIAVKAEDGALRAAEVVLGHALDVVDPASADRRAPVLSSRRVLRNHAGTVVGSLAVV